MDQVKGIEFRKSPWRSHSFEATRTTDEMIRKALLGETSMIEDAVVGKDGKSIPMIFTITPVRDIHGKIIAIIPEGKIIEDQKKLHDKIKKEQWEVQQWIDSMGAYVAICDREGRIISCNQPFLSAMNSKMSEIVGQYICDTTRLGHSSKTQKRLQKAIKNARDGEKISIEVVLNIGADRAKTFLFSVSPIIDESGKVDFLALEIIDISEQVRLRELMLDQEKKYSSRLEIEVNNIKKALKETELFNKNLVNAAPIGLIYLDDEDKLLLANPEMVKKLEKYGITKDIIRGKKLSELGIFLADALWKKLDDDKKHKIALGRMKMIFYNQGKGGLKFDVSAASLKGSSKGITGTILIMDDVTERNRLEEELLRTRIQAEKLSSLKLLISGVAHELNNPLTSIIGCAEHLEEDMSLNKDSSEASKIIINDARRASQIVKSLFDFAEKHKLETAVVNLNEIIRAVVDIRIHEIKKRGIKAVLKLDPVIKGIEANETEMQQVLLNILRNAVNAIEESGVGDRIVVRTFNHQDEVFVEIEDNGPGIPEDHIEKIFDPFFTTRYHKKGTGLGLSLAYGIIQKHRGSISVDTSYRKGARFIIRLPSVDSFAANGKEEKTETIWVPSSVLVVDDEQDVCVGLSSHLNSIGCAVETVKSGEEALYMIKINHYDLLIVDIKMPGMNGLDLYRQLRLDKPQVISRVAFMSESSQQDQEEVMTAMGIPVLRKPFNKMDVVGFLRCLQNLFRKEKL
jgi:PAS domain S-box-containing protein